MNRIAEREVQILIVVGEIPQRLQELRQRQFAVEIRETSDGRGASPFGGIEHAVDDWRFGQLRNAQHRRTRLREGRAGRTEAGEQKKKTGRAYHYFSIRSLRSRIASIAFDISVPGAKTPRRGPP